MALYDGEAEISAAQINTLLAATNNKVAPYWPALFASFLKNGRIESIIFSGGAGGAAPAAAAGGAAPAAGTTPTLHPLLNIYIDFDTNMYILNSSLTASSFSIFILFVP